MNTELDSSYDIEQVVIEPEARASELAQRLTRWARIRRIPILEQCLAQQGRSAPEVSVTRSKRTLYVVQQRGAVLKPCTGRTDSLVCCNLHVVTQTVGCPLDCSYCVLQSYQNRGQITITADFVTILDRLQEGLAAAPQRLHRVCTGQVADSLALEPLVGFVAPAVERLAATQNAVLELKTKTANVEPLLELSHGGRTIVSFTVNPSALAQQEEHAAAPVEVRLAAAARAADRGYLLAFHLDPMLTRDGDPAPFVELIDAIADQVPTDRVAYLSMGTVRFVPTMRRTIAARFPQSAVTQAELLPDVDGKLRMVSFQRIPLYRTVAARIHARFPDAFVYLCMEPRRVWRRALGVDYATRAEVNLAIAQSLHRRFGLAPCEPAAADYPE